VLDQLAAEANAVRAGADEWDQPFTGLARDWRNLLFPTASDETFADGYAQTLTFALLLARTENIGPWLAGWPPDWGHSSGAVRPAIPRSLAESRLTWQAS
jgi:hypothetical protein